MMSSMKIIHQVIVVLALSSIALATSACPEKGPMEKAGEKVDDAIDETKDAIDDKTK
jgi:predicted small lipoprotein YifL